MPLPEDIVLTVGANASGLIVASALVPTVTPSVILARDITTTVTAGAQLDTTIVIEAI